MDVDGIAGRGNFHAGERAGASFFEQTKKTDEHEENRNPLVWSACAALNERNAAFVDQFDVADEHACLPLFQTFLKIKPGCFRTSHG